MTVQQIVQAVDAEIVRLQRVKVLLASGSSVHVVRKRVLSADARARISDAQKRRWAKQKRAA